MTAEETAAGIMADPAWSFAANPTAAISHATGRAANARIGSGAQFRHLSEPQRVAASRLWTAVALLLCEAASVEPGQVLTNLRDGR